MGLNVFLLLPQDENFIYDIIKDQSSFEQFITYLTELLSNIRKEKDINLHYDSENIKQFLDTCKTWYDGIYEDGVYLAKADYKILKSASNSLIC